MKTIFKIIIVIAILVFCYKTYTASQKNGKSFLNNAGQQSKILIEKSKKGIAEFRKGYSNN